MTEHPESFPAELILGQYIYFLKLVSDMEFYFLHQIKIFRSTLGWQHILSYIGQGVWSG